MLNVKEMSADETDALADYIEMLSDEDFDFWLAKEMPESIRVYHGLDAKDEIPAILRYEAKYKRSGLTVDEFMARHKFDKC
jgi:hypothetical protein